LPRRDHAGPPMRRIAGTLPGDVGVERARAENGDIYIWLDPRVLAKFKALRGPGESYSAAILRLAAQAMVAASGLMNFLREGVWGWLTSSTPLSSGLQTGSPLRKAVRGDRLILTSSKM
jgi:hypothetical protein